MTMQFRAHESNIDYSVDRPVHFTAEARGFRCGRNMRP